jgi:hypothetical protein
MYELPDFVKTGVAGAGAMSVQVMSLMWMRTTVNYQYRTGNNMTTSFRNLYADGGVRRFYRGVGPALVQAPLSRFGDTATNAAVIEYLEPYDLPVAVKTGCASVAAAMWRLSLMPIDTLKTTMQVEGKGGLALLRNKMSNNGVKVLYNGAGATFAATWVGHYPWFVTYNTLNSKLPEYNPDTDRRAYKYGRSAIIGFSSSLISDTCSNAIRVCKTYKQTYKKQITYPQIIRKIIAEESITGLLFRGLKTKIISNGIQGMLFTIIWKQLREIM